MVPSALPSIQIFEMETLELSMMNALETDPPNALSSWSSAIAGPRITLPACAPWIVSGLLTGMFDSLYTPSARVITPPGLVASMADWRVENTTPASLVMGAGEVALLGWKTAMD